MNERIKELAIEAKWYARDFSLQQEVFEKKFAKLLIQKCAQIGAQYADGNYEVPNRILEYFGLEEPEK
jgi:hypothetical protein